MNTLLKKFFKKTLPAFFLCAVISGTSALPCMTSRASMDTEKEIPVISEDETENVKAREYNGLLYLPLESLASAAGCELVLESDQAVFTRNGADFLISLHSDIITEANGTYWGNAAECFEILNCMCSVSDGQLHITVIQTPQELINVTDELMSDKGLYLRTMREDSGNVFWNSCLTIAVAWRSIAERETLLDIVSGQYDKTIIQDTLASIIVTDDELDNWLNTAYDLESLLDYSMMPADTVQKISDNILKMYNIEPAEWCEYWGAFSDMVSYTECAAESWADLYRVSLANEQYIQALKLVNNYSDSHSFVKASDDIIAYADTQGYGLAYAWINKDLLNSMAKTYLVNKVSDFFPFTSITADIGTAIHPDTTRQTASFEMVNAGILIQDEILKCYNDMKNRTNNETEILNGLRNLTLLYLKTTYAVFSEIGESLGIDPTDVKALITARMDNLRNFSVFCGETVDNDTISFNQLSGTVSDILSIHDYDYPSDVLSTGDTFKIYGTVTSSVSNISHVTVEIVDENGNWYTGGSASPNARTYDLSSFDAGTRFGVLPANNYIYRVTAANESGTTTLVEYPFSVKQEDNNLLITGYRLPPSMAPRTPWSISGTITSNNGNLTEVVVRITDEKGNCQSYGLSNPNSHTYNIAELDRYLLFSKLETGNYFYSISAATDTGIIETLVYQPFIVR